MRERYAFLAGPAEKGGLPLARRCQLLGVSRSGFYGWAGRPPAPAGRRRVQLAGLVTAVFLRSDGRYGARRVAAALRASGIRVSVRLVGRLMAEGGLVACQPRRYRRTTVADPAAEAPADLLCRDFTAPAPGVKLVGDITYVRSWTGWCYLATVIDCFSRRVVGWSMNSRMDPGLVCAALRMAATRTRLAAGAVFHSDRGSQYTSTAFADCCARLGVTRSVGRTGICWDNALAESFFASLKNELCYRTAFPTPSAARHAIARYIELFYNPIRLHSTLGYRSPNQAEIDYYTTAKAA